MASKKSQLSSMRHVVGSNCMKRSCLLFGQRRKRNIILWIALIVIICFTVKAFGHETLSQNGHHGRKLLSSSSCHSQPKWIKQGGFILYLIGVCYLFLGISIVCDSYFINSMEDIVEKLGLSEDVAGATFLAAGSSAPELFVSLVSLINNNTSNEIGVGTIVGSAVFNILIIIGLTALFAGQALRLDYRPLLRDSVVYAAAILGIAIMFHDGRIHWQASPLNYAGFIYACTPRWEGLISVVLYCGYVAFMPYNQQLLAMLPAPKLPVYAGEDDLQNPEQEASNHTQAFEGGQGTAAPLLENINQSSMRRLSDLERADSMILSEVESSKESLTEKIIYVLSYPWDQLFTLTIPNCSEERWKGYYFLTFATTAVWIGIISWFMVEWAADIGCALGIPSTVMGVTLLAAGTSIPDALASIAVAKEGKGDMAVANAIGSNIFDIWIGLGLPWLIIIPFNGEHDQHGMYISVSNSDLITSVLMLFGVLIFYTCSIALFKWKLYPVEGYLFIILYGFYALYYIVIVWALDLVHEDE